MATYYVDGAVGNDGNAGTSQGSGNAWATIAHALSSISAGNIVYVKASGTYSISSGLNHTVGNFDGPRTRIIGYTTSPGDNGQATIQLTSGDTNAVNLSGTGQTWENFIVDANSNAGRGIYLSGAYGNHIINCSIKNFTSEGARLESNGS